MRNLVSRAHCLWMYPAAFPSGLFDSASPRIDAIHTRSSSTIAMLEDCRRAKRSSSVSPSRSDSAST